MQPRPPAATRPALIEIGHQDPVDESEARQLLGRDDLSAADTGTHRRSEAHQITGLPVRCLI